MNSELAAADQLTVCDHLIEHLRSKDVALDGQVRPAAILWTDPARDWLPLVEMMRTRVEELLVLGDYAPEDRTGPAIWLRCMVDGALTEPALPAGRVPILYLPGVARQDLRAGESCREELKPLVELMHRGALWLQHNGSDWRATTFLTSSTALNLDIAGDRSTLEALLRALPELALTPVSQLAVRRLEADDFDRMLSSDVIRDVLRWMGDPAGTKARIGENGWGAFCSRCREELSFDPEREADVTAGERMAMAEGAWSEVWRRFEESPTSFDGIVDLLRRSRPGGSFSFNRDPWPDLNDEDEAKVRQALSDLDQLGHGEACNAAAQLEAAHGRRRDLVWARLDLSPMARVLEPISRLAKASRSPVGGTTLDEIAASYVASGWEADAAAWEAVAAVPTTDEALIGTAVRHLLEPWLEDSARAFQSALERTPIPEPGKQPQVQASADGCVLFADGLRYDLGIRLSERLEGRGYRTALGHRWAAAPTVTATAKPAVTPVADQIKGESLGEDFGAVLQASGKPANAQNLRAAMQKAGYQILGTGGLDAPMEDPAYGWLENGDIDTLGHKVNARLARHIDDELERLTDRIVSLLESGWKSVRVVTDHGWLLLPGGLPKVDLPKHLTASRWARCAVLSGDASPEIPRYPWHWNAAQSFAVAPGIACFNKTEEYAHGGLSVQECLTPDLFVEHGGERVAHASIDSVTWKGLRCFIEATTGAASIVADLRLDSPAGASVASKPKQVETDGSVSLVLADDEHEDANLVLVLLDEPGNIVAQKPTQVGTDS